MVVNGIEVRGRHQKSLRAESLRRRFGGSDFMETVTRADFDKAVRELFEEEGFSIGNNILPALEPTFCVIELLNRKLFGQRPS
jgi:hypothetical protein